jgi:thiol:disulfide interchange protein DsbC
MKLKILPTVIFSLLPLLPANAVELVPQAVLDSASKLFSVFTSADIIESDIPGLYQIPVGSNIVYVSEDGRYALRGDIIDTELGINLTERERNKKLGKLIDEIEENSMIVFAPEEIKSTITVFTDITCPYCAKLHNEVPQLNANGIKVRYLAFPRVGIPSSVADDMASVWCADDPQQALTDAKAGFGVPDADERCVSPVSEHYNLGLKIGIGGTPTIILEDGSILGGYVPYLELVEAAQQAHLAVR